MNARRAAPRLVAALAAAALAAAGPAAGCRAQAAAEPPDPRELVAATYEQIKTIATEAATQDELTARVTAALSPLVDWPAFSEKTLTAAIWAELDSGRKKAFQEAYEAFVVDRYARRFKPHTRFRVEMRGPTERAEDGRHAVVRTTVLTDHGGEEVGVDVDYHFLRLGEGARAAWRVEDIETDTVSRAHTYRPRFTRIYRERGFDTLLEAIRANVKKGGEDD